MTPDAFEYYAKSTSTAVHKQMDLMVNRLRDMALTIEQNMAFAEGGVDAKHQLTMDVDALRLSVNDLHNNLMCNTGISNATGLMIEAGKLLAVNVE